MPEILNLEIKLGKHIYNIGEPILIECNIVNIGQNSINLSPILFNDLEIYLKHENDKEYAPFGPIILLKELIRKEGIIKLGPGQNHSFIRKIDEKAYVMFNKLGRYEIYLTYSNLMKDLENVKLWVGEIKSNAVQFEIQNHRQQTQQAKPS